jgi:arginyl-tRNA synthetase
MIERQRTDLHAFGVDFDTWFSEQSLHDSGEVERCVDEMIAKGAADEDPHRVVLKMARGGVIEEVKKEAQSETMESEELLEGEVTGTAGVSPAQSELGTSATLWLRSTKFGDDMDRVLRRRDGRLTYIASDVAYHKDKFNRPPNADKLITILGPDHHGYIHRLQAVLAALLETPSPATVGQAAELSQDSPRGVGEGAGGEGLDEVESAIYKSAAERDACKSALEEARRKLEVVIFQIVRFVKDGKPAPMRKRDGNIYELRDLISELGQAVAAKATKEEQQRIGVDVARFFYLMRSHDTHMDFDIDLATKQSDDNPVFYVQYAYARICSVLRKAGEARIGGLEDWGIGQPIPILQSFNPSILTHPREQSLIKKILDLPLEVQRITEDYGVHRLTTYAIELARTYHHFYDACRVIQTEEPELSKARLALCEAARLTLKATLDLLGVSAPERMEREEPTG